MFLNYFKGVEKVIVGNKVYNLYFKDVSEYIDSECCVSVFTCCFIMNLKDGNSEKLKDLELLIEDKRYNSDVIENIERFYDGTHITGDVEIILSGTIRTKIVNVEELKELLEEKDKYIKQLKRSVASENARYISTLKQYKDLLSDCNASRHLIYRLEELENRDRLREKYIDNLYKDINELKNK